MCRDFRDEPVSADVLDAVLAAAFRGPTAGNTDMLDIVVLRGPETARYWDVTLPEDRRSRFRWPGLLRAPVLVIPVVDPDAYVRRYGEDDKAHAGLGGATTDWPVPYWWVDGGAAVMALLLAAERHGLGSLLFGQMGHEPEVAAALGVPDGRRSVGTVALGHPAPGGRNVRASAQRERPRPENRIHRDRW
jgi:nitroreductase